MSRAAASIVVGLLMGAPSDAHHGPTAYNRKAEEQGSGAGGKGISTVLRPLTVAGSEDPR